MISLIDNNPIRRAFSNAAMQYDVLTGLHKEIGRDLIKKICDIEDPAAVLDVGMGTGSMTRRLTFYFPEAAVVGMDFSPGMIDFVKRQRDGFYLVEADARGLPFKKATFDVIVSNLAYQWVADLPTAFRSCYNSLKDNGTLALTMFGHDTLKEMFISLQNSGWNSGSGTGEKNEPPVRRLAKQDDVLTGIRGAGFQNVESRVETITVHFKDMWGLLKWLKDIGANALPKDVYIGKQWLARANAYYHKNFKDRFGVSVTFEVIWVVAKK